MRENMIFSDVTEMIRPGSARARPFPGRQRRLGGPAMFTPPAPSAGLFKQSGCLHSARGRHQLRQALMWPFSGVPREQEMLAAEKIKPQQPFVPVAGTDKCGPKKMVERHQNPPGRPDDILDPGGESGCQGFSILPLQISPAPAVFSVDSSPVACE